MPKKIKMSSFVGGKVVNCRGKREYNIEGLGNVTFKIDKNLAIYDVTPRKCSVLGNVHDILSVVRGQVPDSGAQTLSVFVDKWYADAERYA